MRGLTKQLSGFLLSGLLGSVLIAGCSVAGSPSNGAPPLAASPVPRGTAAPVGTGLPTYAVRLGEISGDVALRGRVGAVNENTLFFRAGGRIKQLNVTLGQEVQANQVLAEVEGQNLEAELAKSKADLQTAKVNLQFAQPTEFDRAAQAKLAVGKAEQVLERAKVSLAKLKAGPTTGEIEAAKLTIDQAGKALWAAQIERDAAKGNTANPGWMGKAGDAKVATAETAVAMAESRLKQLQEGPRPEDVRLAENEVAQAEVALAAARAEYAFQVADRTQRMAVLDQQFGYLQTLYDLAERRRGDTKLIAPFNGVVVALSVAPGDQVEPYVQVGAVADPSKLQIEANAREPEIALIGVGTKASIALDGFPQEKYAGSVTSIAAKPMLWQGQNVYTVTIGFSDRQVPASLRMGADITIGGKSRGSTLLVPRQAVQTAESGQSYVERVADGKPRRVEVRTGVSNGDFIEIVSGLREGDLIVEGRRAQ